MNHAPDERTSSQLQRARRALMALAVFTAALVIVPSVASAGDGGPSDLGVQPVEVNLGGQNNDCSEVVSPRLPSAAPFDYRLENPKESGNAVTTTPEGAVVTVAVTGNNTLLSFSISQGWVIYDVIVKGGADSAHFDYDTNGGPGPVIADSGLHAPTKGGGNKLHSVSHVSFCYGPAVPISGIVFEDLNQNSVQDAGEPPVAGQTIAVYDANGDIAGTATSGTDGSWAVFVPQNNTYTVCQDEIPDYLQTLPGNTDCVALGDSEPGGYIVNVGLDPVGGFVFGSTEEICGQFLNEAGVVFTGDFELFENGDGEADCIDKAGVLFETTDAAGNPVLALPLIGAGEVAGIGVITKQYPTPTSYVPVEYAQSATDTYEQLPWCTLRARLPQDGTQFDAYLADLSTYPSLVGVNDPVSGDQSVSCKVYEEQTIEGAQTTVVYVQDDPFWR